MRYGRDHGLLMVADVKRGDIGSTAEAYASAYLAPSFGRDPMADACTVNPYLGTDGLHPFVAEADRHGTGLFILAKTSNPSSAELQDLTCDEREIYKHVGGIVAELNAERLGTSGYGPVGAVVGATWPELLVEKRRICPGTFFLLPGYGAQGAGAADVAGAFDDEGLGGLVTASRSISFPWKAGEPAPDDWEARIVAAAERMRDDLRALAGSR